MKFSQLSRKLTKNRFDDEDRASKSQFDLE